MMPMCPGVCVCVCVCVHVFMCVCACVCVRARVRASAGHLGHPAVYPARQHQHRTPLLSKAHPRVNFM